MSERELFVAALRLQSSARVQFLEEACRGNKALRERIESLLSEYEQLGSFLESEVAKGDNPETHLAESNPDATVDHPGENLGTIIAGKYKLIELIGEGGMGSVWRAQQSEPVKRYVAVKLIKSGMDSKVVLARFETERQALAVMDHPNIAKILDGGVSETGSPYFVMELVKGVPITEFCDARKLTPKQRLELFVPVCQAIQHAHQKGIIHRDIKPSNVLIALYDDMPIPKVIDFGIAKATGQSLTDNSYHTAFGGIVGTPEYMSPEQASLNNLDIDTRSDVYSLGVLLYELLAGSPPFARPELEKRGILEILRVVREEEPVRPSIKLSTANALPNISANRGTEPKKLTGLLRNELDWIVMKALDKDRARRYDSANGLAKDVQRFLTGDSVEACPPTLGYRMGKTYRRNKVAVWVATAFVSLMLASTIIGARLTIQAKRAEGVAEKNAEAFYGAMSKADNALQQLELTALNQRIDTDLAAISKYPRPHTGLLRLARTLVAVNPQIHRRYSLEGGGEIVFQAQQDFIAKQLALREYLVVAILAAGQEYGSLLPPITHDGVSITELKISQDSQFLITLGADRVTKLWDARTSQRLAVLRSDSESVVRFGFSPDGKTAFTDDENYIVRIWDIPSGRLRARIDTIGTYLPKTDSIYRDVSLSNDRLLTSTRYHVFAHDAQEKAEDSKAKTRGTIILWDSMSGRRIARLDRPHVEVETFELLGPRLISSSEGSTVVLYSSENGKEVVRLSGPVGMKKREVLSSPDGNWIVTTYDNWNFRVWRTDTWQGEPATSMGNWEAHCVLNDGTVLMRDWRDGQTCSVYRSGQSNTVVAHQGSWSGLPNQGNLSLLHDGRIVDTQTRQLVPMPAAGEPNKVLARFAPDGRFLMHVSIDSATGKHLPISQNWWPSLSIEHDRYWRDAAVVGYLPRVGQVAFSLNDHDRAEVRLIPLLDRLALPAEQLELWLQVALRGELGPGDEYIKWDEPTWERKRQQLAATPQPFSDLPFPGHLSTDKLHWLRMEFFGDWIRNGVEKTADREFLSKIASELLRRSEAEGNQGEVDRWNQKLSQQKTEVAPVPRLVK
ncbi:MAG: serine/threonine-protein kinase [Gemmataceae bacterium]